MSYFGAAVALLAWCGIWGTLIFIAEQAEERHRRLAETAKGEF